MWPKRQETADLITFTEEILNEKLHFLYSVSWLVLVCYIPSMYANTVSEIKMNFMNIIVMSPNGKSFQ